MKKTMKYVLGALVISGLSLTSCIGDLNVDPIDPNLNTADKALKDEASFKAFLAGVYTGFATSGYHGPNGDPSISGLDGGASQYVRGLFNLNELPTDESMCNWNDQTIMDFHAMSWTTSDVFIYAFYSRVLMQISVANEFIRQAKAASDFASKEAMIAEARTLRGLCYLHAIDNFGNVPFADETSSVGATLPKQLSRAELFQWLEKELKDIIDNSPLPEKNEYGRITKNGARMILAKLYLNAQVYTGSAGWDDCAKVLKDITGHSLHANYADLFRADNDKCTDEIIFAIQQDGITTQSYGVTNYIVFASTGDGMDAASVGISSGWGGLRATDTFYRKFEKDDARKMFSDDEFHKGPVADVGDFTAGGHPAMKFVNINIDGSAAQAAGFVDIDFPVFRYADALLMLAECGLNGSAVVSKSDAQGYFNEVRHRAGLGDAELSAANLIDERGRELYLECWRRSDLIRFGLFTGTDYVWDWKAGAENGTGTDAHRSLYPIPNQDRSGNPNLKQNPGYSGNNI